MSDITLIFPRLESEKVMLLPMAVLTVAAPLVEAGFSVKIIDQRADKKWRETLIAELKQEPLLVGISALTGKQIKYGLAATRIVKENSKTPVVLGGVHASLLPRQTLEHPLIDFVIVGEGENALCELAKNLKNGGSYFGIKGLGYKKDNQIFLNSQGEFIDLDKIPEIPYHLINIEDYIAKRSYATGKPGRSLALYTSRGCPHRCSFCYNLEFNKRKWRGESAQKVVERMKKLVKEYGITSFEMEDDEFFVNFKRVGEICDLILKEGLKVDLITTCRVNYTPAMSDDFIKLLADAGFRALTFGVETGSQRILEMIKKDITFEQVFETIRRFGKAGINSKFFFMAGFPTETKEDLYATIDLIWKMKELDNRIRVPSWRITTPFPGTELYDLSAKHGFIQPKSLEEWAEFGFGKVKTPWVTRRNKKIIENAAFLFRYIKLGRISEGKSLWHKLGRIYGKIADFRWKKHLFSFLPEKYLINFAVNLRKAVKN